MLFFYYVCMVLGDWNMLNINKGEKKKKGIVYLPDTI